ncbi:hypothetical protein HID58_072093 [Brassica napus]|uniref:Leucine-rich repeat-containing N-terminal plant-type domain-containing protein n=1 Tax=Brassica napus TaxID=3708 RepID=A0ABQ7Z3L3_BRANA|nr:hypothetical protein HID58_072093 [Brassica napus]
MILVLRSLSMLDISNNNLTGVIPSWMGEFTSLTVILLSNNSLEGAQTKIEFATKHRYDAYMGANLQNFSGLELSENELSGEIPVKLGGLLKLHVLNLSYNYLSGVIPRSFSGMKSVESLDLSFNKLQGKIPPQLADLSSLSVFNVSYNNLSGVIPQGRQFNTFDMQSYLGNPLLCGQPTNISCNGKEQDNNGVKYDESTIDMVSFYWSCTAAYVTLLFGILASLSFESSWRRAWFLCVVTSVFKYLQLHGYKSCIQKERKALFELKQYLISISVEWALDSVLPTWTNDSKSDCCRWDGIKCNHTGGRVIGIFISKTSFKERSPLNLYLLHPFEDVRILNFSGRSNQFSVFCEMKNLRELDLSGNNFVGQLPPCLGSLNKLRFLDLSSNLLSGNLPSSFSSLQSLEYLSLADNNCTGLFSFSPLANLTKLKVFKLSRTSVLRLFLSSSMDPSCRCFHRLSKKSFFLKSRQLRNVFVGQYLICVMLLLGLLHGCKSCIEKERKALLELKKYILLRAEEGSDFILNTWTNDTKSNCCLWEGIECNQISLRIIKISTGKSSVVEDSVLDLSLLNPFEEVRSLDLSGDGAIGFSGLFDDLEGYKSRSRLQNLEFLDFSANTFNNSIFPFLNAATSVKTLILQFNVMYGPLPLKGLCNLKNLQELDISHNELAGQFPLCIASLTGLRVLDLSSNQLSGEVPPALSNLESLEYLSLVDNNFEGFFSLASLANNTKLKVVTLSSKSNSLQVDMVTSWKPKFQLSVISLRSCNLKEVPGFLLYQKELRQVDLSNNIISGMFPSWLLENNTKLEVLLLKNNSFSSFGLPKAAHKMLFLDVSVNEFNQLFPENIGWILPNLRHMNLSENNFQGNLPSSLGNMESMHFLDVSHNSFNGKL